MSSPGLTWTGEKSLIDGLIDLDEAGEVMYYLSYLYSISDALAVGINYMDGYMGGDLIGLKGRYQLGDGALSFSYTTADRFSTAQSSASATRRASRGEVKPSPALPDREGGRSAKSEYQAWQRGRPSSCVWDRLSFQ